MTTRQAGTVFSSIQESIEESRTAALFEIKNLKKDLGVLEKIVSGKQKKLSITPHDIVHSGLEIFRHATSILANEELIQRIEGDLGQASAYDFLDKHGASLLKKPAGWHWISPAGEMHFLGKATEPDKAAKKLEGLAAPKKKRGKNVSSRTAPINADAAE